ncbi:hypothetical protein I316_00220 [Kwoniella heveanensis BCC8398]|uniref:YTH domain-containing protein n=1 Tax=Kwoniella heveanensis BCC8398 TaxID=1296120 RepID=A0A1B9H3Z7_9TREE|nr:hypothetical protein I316_00220 [Kwoniella heveanensis BCC8398]
MASAPVAPIRQPRGPSANSFGAPSPSPQSSSSGPPEADSESLLRRHNTVSTTRHQPSASISGNPAASSAFHGAKGRTGVSRFRSGSLSSGTPDQGLVRKGSGREVRTERAVLEHQVEEGSSGMESGTWGKGLSRQSSLPSRRVINPVTAVQQAQTSTEASNPSNTSAPPPRPPRRIAVSTQNLVTLPQPPSAHIPSHSLSSLTMLSPPQVPMQQPQQHKDDQHVGSGANVSRTQSLRAQAKHSDGGNLGRSTSLKATREQYRPLQALSPPSQTTTPRNPFTPPSPPPVSSTAALPPFQLPLPDQQNYQAQMNPGADLKRHQSLTQGYGSSNRVRDRLERSPAVLTLEQREDIRRRMTSSKTPDNEQPPISPIVPSVWSPSIPAGQDDGWSRAASQQLQDAFDAMNLGRRMMGAENNNSEFNGDRKMTLESNVLRHPQPATATGTNGHHFSHSGEEPSWVASLIGGDHTPQVAPRSAGPTTMSWQDRDTSFRQQAPHSFTPQPHQQLARQQGGWTDPNQFMHQPQLSFLQQQQLLASAGGFGGMKGMQPFQQPLQPPYLGAPFSPAYPSPPSTAMVQGQGGLSNQDRDVIELARQKGLNPATYNCRPYAARFFVIKSYTEDDVQKSLKHEIWSSTVLGNKRLDNAYKESSDKGPIYLFFSVNGSRHFCGVAQMLTPVDETQTSTVWAQDKWKGTFKVKWIFVRDVPSQALRHIRLTNTPEKKPITNSRDTQELPYEAGCEVLQIFLEHQNKSKTSLLQDFAYYERLSANRALQGQNSNPGAQAQPLSQTMMPQPPMTAMPPMPPINMQMPPPSAIPPVPTIPARFR